MEKWKIYLAATKLGHSLSSIARAADINATAILKSTSGNADPRIGSNAEERREHYWNTLTPEERVDATRLASDLMTGIPLVTTTNGKATTMAPKSKLTLETLVPDLDTIDAMVRRFLAANGVTLAADAPLPKSAKDLVESFEMLASDVESFVNNIEDEVKRARQAYLDGVRPGIEGMSKVPGMTHETIAATFKVTVDEVKAVLTPPAPVAPAAPVAATETAPAK